MKKVVVIVLAAIVLVALYTGYQNLTDYVHYSLDDFRYTTSEREEYAKCESVDVIKQKDKEPIYVVFFDNYDKATLTEGEFEKYIGEGNNAVPVKQSFMIIYRGKKSLFGRETDFTGKVKSNTNVFWKTIFPWETDEKPYTKEDAKNFVITMIKNKEVGLQEWKTVDVKDLENDETLQPLN